MNSTGMKPNGAVPACVISNLQMQVPDGNGGRRLILDMPELQIARAGITAISGASGSGKTTLLHCLTGIHQPTSGGIRMHETQINALGEANRDTWRRTQVGLVFQDFQLVPEMTALQNVLLPTHFARTSLPSDRASALLENFGITQPNIAVKNMSRGEQQRVAFARALLFSPPFLVADEPTASLDHDNSKQIIEALQRCAANGQVVIVSSHDPNLLEVAGTVVKLAHGRAVGSDQRAFA